MNADKMVWNPNATIVAPGTTSRIVRAYSSKPIVQLAAIARLQLPSSSRANDHREGSYYESYFKVDGIEKAIRAACQKVRRPSLIASVLAKIAKKTD